MEGHYNDEDLERILAENDPIQGLSRSELLLLNDILIKKRRKLDASMPHMDTEADKSNINPEYAIVCMQMRTVETRLSEQSLGLSDPKV